VTIRDPAGVDVLAEWQFREAFPTKWQGPDLNATQNSVAVETLELCHQGLERQR
jgi:phage tail-like protein